MSHIILMTRAPGSLRTTGNRTRTRTLQCVQLAALLPFHINPGVTYGG